MASGNNTPKIKMMTLSLIIGIIVAILLAYLFGKVIPNFIQALRDAIKSDERSAWQTLRGRLDLLLFTLIVTSTALTLAILMSVR